VYDVVVKSSRSLSHLLMSFLLPFQVFCFTKSNCCDFIAIATRLPRLGATLESYQKLVTGHDWSRD